MEIHQRLERVIAETAISQATIARRIGETPMWLNNRITGRVPLRLAEIERIAEAVRMRPCDLACRLLEDGSSGGRSIRLRPLHELPGMRELARQTGRGNGIRGSQATTTTGCFS